MYPILKLINLLFLSNNQYIAPNIFIHVFFTIVPFGVDNMVEVLSLFLFISKLNPNWEKNLAVTLE